MLLFLLLMAIHMGAYWKAGDYSFTVKQWIIYVALRTTLGFAICVLVGNSTVWAIIFFSLSAETLRVPSRYDTAEGTIFFYSVLPIFVPLFLPNDTSLRDWVGWVGPLMVFTGVLTVIYKRQFEANARAEQLIIQLEAANQQISAYAKQVQELTLASERQRVARELHDTLAQGVAGMALQLEAADAHLENENFKRGQAIVQQVMNRAHTTLAEARAAINDLRGFSTRLSLCERLHKIVQRFQSVSGIIVKELYDLGEFDYVLDPSTKEHIDRIASEAMTNIVKHAEATQVTISAVMIDNMVVISVQDDGVGFDTSGAANDGQYGLIGMRERARLIGGTIQVESLARSGTKITLTIPTVRGETEL